MIIDLFVCLSVALTCNLSFEFVSYRTERLKEAVEAPYITQRVNTTSKLNQNVKADKVSVSQVTSESPILFAPLLKVELMEKP